MGRRAHGALVTVAVLSCFVVADALAQMGAAHWDSGVDDTGYGTLGWGSILIVIGSFAFCLWVCVKSENLWGQAVLYGSNALFIMGLVKLGKHFGFITGRYVTADRDALIEGVIFICGGLYFVYKALKEEPLSVLKGDSSATQEINTSPSAKAASVAIDDRTRSDSTKAVQNSSEASMNQIRDTCGGVSDWLAIQPRKISRVKEGVEVYSSWVYKRYQVIALENGYGVIVEGNLYVYQSQEALQGAVDGGSLLPSAEIDEEGIEDNGYIERLEKDTYYLTSARRY